MFVIRASGIYMVGRALAALMTIASIAIFSRLLAPSDYGVYTLTITTAALFNALFCTWVIQSVFRTYSEASDVVRLQSTGLFALALSALVSTLAAAAAVLLSGRPITLELMLGILMLFSGFSAYEYCNIQLTLQQRPYLFAQLQLTRLALTLTLPLGAFFLFGGFDHFMLGLGFAYWLPLLVPRFSTWASGVGVRHVDRDLLGSLARYGMPLSVSILLVQLGMSLDRYILGAQHGPEAVAGYAAGADLALFSIGMMASSLSQAFYPQLLQLHAAGKAAEQQDLYSQYMLVFVGLLVPSAIGLFFVSGELASLVVGKSIRADTAASLALFAGTAFFFNFKTFVIDVRFQIAKRTGQPMVTAVVIIGLLMGGCFLLIPSMGGIGAAWASLVATVAGCGLALLLSMRVPGALPFPMSELGKVAVAATTMTAVLWGVDHWMHGAGGWIMSLIRLGAEILIGAATYGAVLLALNFRPARQILDRLPAIWARRRPF